MADEHEPADDAQRAAVREWYRGERARLDAISDEEWAASREAEMRYVREWAARRRRSAA